MSIPQTTHALTPLANATADTCGAKAGRLAELIRLGVDVPDGVVVDDAAFQQFLNERELRPTINLHLQRSDDLAAASDRIRQQVLSSPPPPLIDALQQWAEGDSAERFAVRSSAVGEDSDEAAFAGQLDSFLNVEQGRPLSRALLECWASYWSHRCLAYQEARKHRLSGMGVIIQRQVDAVVSGVLFTRDFRSPESGEMLAELCAGLGDRCVSGDVRPHRLRLSDNSWRLEPGEESAPDAIGDALAAKLFDVGRALEEHFGAAQDIEWCLDSDGRLRVVQSRPITSLAGAGRQTTAEPRVVWSNANVNENFPDPVCPLLYSIASVGYYHYFRNLGAAAGISPDRIESMEYPLRNIIGAQAGRIYYNLTNIHAVLRSAPRGDLLSDAFNRFVGAQPTAQPTERPNDAGSSGWAAFRRGRIAQSRELLWIGWRTWRLFRRLERGVSAFERRIDQYASTTEPKSLRELDRASLLERWREFLRIRCDWNNAATADAASMISYGLCRRMLQSELPEEDGDRLTNRLLSGRREVVSGLPAEQLWSLSRMIRSAPAVRDDFMTAPVSELRRRIETDRGCRELRAALTDFLDNWGYRCSGELMLTEPSYQEQPERLLELLRAYVARDDESVEDQQNAPAPTSDPAMERIVGELSRRPQFRYLPWPRKSWVARRLIRWMRGAVACRERARLKQALLYSRLRRLALEIGRRFVQDGGLDHADDVFFFTHAELEQWLAGAVMHPAQMRELAGLRRAAHEGFLEQRPPDRIELAAGEYWRETQIAADGAEVEQSDRCWRGEAVCGGRAEGRAVVLTDPTQLGQLAEGDILVTRQTDPGWGPVLFLVRGLVMERGGMLSHGAILAREYGIPTVVDVRDATRRLVTGQTILVDGDRGVIEVLD